MSDDAYYPPPVEPDGERILKWRLAAGHPRPLAGGAWCHVCSHGNYSGENCGVENCPFRVKDEA